MLVVRVKSPDGQMTYEGALLNLEKQYVLRCRTFNLVLLDLSVNLYFRGPPKKIDWTH